jgi:hypothetical protein
MSRQTISTASQSYLGKVYYEKYHNSSGAGARLGLQIPQMYSKQFGAIAAADPDGIVNGGTATATGGTTFTLATTAALVATAGTATFDVPRNIVVTATDGGTTATGITFTFTGTDEYGATLVETMTGPSATAAGSTSAGTKTFKTVTAASVDGATARTIDIGSGNVLGSPVKIASKDAVIALGVDGLPVSPTIVTGLATGTTANATNADVRGTVTMATSVKPNASRKYTLTVLVPKNQRKIDVFGNTPYGG